MNSAVVVFYVQYPRKLRIAYNSKLLSVSEKGTYAPSGKLIEGRPASNKSLIISYESDSMVLLLLVQPSPISRVLLAQVSLSPHRVDLLGFESIP